MATPLPDIDGTSDEATTLVQFLDFYRAVARRKAEGLSVEQLRQRLPGHPSSLTVGGILYHLASVEDWWASHILLGGPVPEPWASGWDADDDFDFALDFDVDRLGRGKILAQFDTSVSAARKAFAGVRSLAAEAAIPWQGEPVSARWILVHLVEEYARHCGHLDLLREAVDGTTGD